MAGSYNVPSRTLGKDGPQVPVMGFGMMGLSLAYGAAPSDPERFAAIDAAYDAGARHFDTAQVYGDCEELFGKWLAQRADPKETRKNIFLATKFAMSWNAETGQSGLDGTPENARNACEASLKKLGVDCIDLYYMHRLDPTVPIEVTVEGLAALQREGKIKYIGLSEVSAATLRRAYKVAKISAVQVEYSPFALDIEANGVLETCRELGIAIVAYSPLGRGILTGQYKSPDDFEPGDFRSFSPRFSKENFGKNLELVKDIEVMAKNKNVTPGQFVLSWILSQGDDFFPIPGSKKVKYINENTAAVNVNLDDKEKDAIRKACEGFKTVGERYPEGMTHLLYADSIPLEGYDPAKRHK